MLLTDRELRQYLDCRRPILDYFTKPCKWYDRDSPVQPSSLDLHIGEMFVPPLPDDKKEADLIRKTEHVLKPGQSVVAITRESISLPQDIAAFGFPPTRLSNRAILMTNPGHVDPGFKGKLRFTLINMGQEAYGLNTHTVVVTLLLVRLNSYPEKDWSARGNQERVEPSPVDLRLLGRDFLDIDNRARTAARTEIRREDLRLRWLQIMVPIVVAIIAAGAAFVGSWLQASGQISRLEARIDHLPAEAELQRELSNLRRAIEEME